MSNYFVKTALWSKSSLTSLLKKKIFLVNYFKSLIRLERKLSIALLELRILSYYITRYILSKVTINRNKSTFVSLKIKSGDYTTIFITTYIL